MDEFVKKQLERMGYNETENADIYLALKEVNELDFRGLTVQKIRHLIPNRADVQMDILERIEVLRANEAMIAHQNSNASSNSVENVTVKAEPGSSSGDHTSQRTQIKTEIKPEPIDYSSGSDVEILNSEDDEPESEEAPVDDDSDASVIIERTPRRPKKRVNVVDLKDEVSSAVGNAKVARSEEDNHEGTERNPVEEVNQSESESDSDEWTTTNNLPNESSSTSTPSSRSTLRRGASRNISFEKYFDPEYTHISPDMRQFSKAQAKRKRDPDHIPTKKCYTLVDAEYIETVLRIFRNGDKLPRKFNYKIDFSVEDNGNDLSVFYDNLGKYVQRLELEFWTWIPTPHHSSNSKPKDWWNTDLGKILYYFCPKLQVLNLRVKRTFLSENCNGNSVQEVEMGRENLLSGGQFSKLPNLKEINLTNTSKAVLRQLDIMFKAAENLERFQFAFEKVTQVEEILNLIQKVSCESSLQELQELSIVGLRDDVSLSSKHFLLLSKSNLVKLNYIEIGCGLENVSKESFESMLKKFSSTLEVFHCRGTFFGRDSKYFSITVPKMDKLRYFSLGADYEFDSARTERNRNTFDVRTEDGDEQLAGVHDVDEEDFVNFGLQMCHMYVNVETIKIGNMCTLEDLHFFNFPNLKTFRVGGPWDRMIKFPSSTSRHSSYLKIEAIQIPDCLMNLSLIPEVSRVFPNLTKVWMWLPSAQCLERFLKTMVKSNLKKLYLKTNFCFSWTLEEILIGKHLSRKRSAVELKKLEKLKMYKYCQEYVAFHNIDFPPEMLEGDSADVERNEDSAVEQANIIEFFNRQLKTFEVEHVGRVLRIPKGDYSFKDSRCEYHSDEIGYLTSYPLSTKLHLSGFTVTSVNDDGEDRRRYKSTNISIPRVRSENVYRPNKYMYGGCECGDVPCYCRTGAVDNSTGNRDGNFGRTTTQYKLKIKPSSNFLSNQSEKVKAERRT